MGKNDEGSRQPNAQQKWDIPPWYTLRQIVGAGSYGHVCEAVDTRCDRIVAIKRIHRVFEDLIDCKRILREISILNRLDSDHVVRVHDICKPNSLDTFEELYLVIEICDSDMKKLFRTSVFLTELHVKTLLYNLMVGVNHIHSAGVLHRDLKPANCLVNQDCTVKICDFSLSRAIEMERQLHLQPLPFTPRDASEINGLPVKRQLTGHVVTRWYRAPELILLEEEYDHKIDIWSVGCILAELLGMLKVNCPFPADRSPLFPGSSCFPLSPDQKHVTDFRSHTRGNRDQLNVIFNVLGTPTDAEIDNFEKDDARRYIRCFAKRKGTGIPQKFIRSPKEVVNLLEGMLRVAPNKRLTTREVISHPYLKDVMKKEKLATYKVFLPFETWPVLDETTLRSFVLHEIAKHHDDMILPDKYEVGEWIDGSISY